MAIESLQNSFLSSIMGTYEPETVAAAATQESDVSFANIFQDVLQGAIDTEKVDNSAAMAVLANENISLHDAMIAGTEAQLSLQLTVEIRNKIVDAYTEIMRMQV